ncbi:hypothetical protein PFISCL1PPCAC_21287, partial [Pristionchus fissidentatus]
SASHSRIDDLYTAISELPVALFDSSSSTAFVHFARAFAVVMEESCMQRMEKRQQSMSSVDDLARMFKQDLQSSLVLTNTLTKDARCSSAPMELLLNRMAAVLRVMVDTNFGSAGHSRLSDLYSTIAAVQTTLLGSSCFGIAFVHFARAFAVVMEESVRQLQQLQQPRPSEEDWRITDISRPASTPLPASPTVSTVASSTVSSTPRHRRAIARASGSTGRSSLQHMQQRPQTPAAARAARAAANAAATAADT